MTVTYSRLVADLRSLGVRAGGVAIVHARMSALGWVIGSSETVVRALLETLGPEGTLMAYACWEEHVYRADERPAHEDRDAFLAGPPVFDPATAEAARDHGRIPERVRTWPGAVHSGHPEAAVVAVGARSGWLVSPQPADDAYGAESPFARLVEADGQVLMLGAPLDTLSLLHHAEAIARVPDKRRLTFTVAMAERGGVVERTFTDIDTFAGPFPYDALDLGEDPFVVIGREALAAGIGARGTVGAAGCHLFEARELTAFAVAWMEERFGSG